MQKLTIYTNPLKHLSKKDLDKIRNEKVTKLCDSRHYRKINNVGAISCNYVPCNKCPLNLRYNLKLRKAIFRDFFHFKKKCLKNIEFKLIVQNNIIALIIYKQKDTSSIGDEFTYCENQNIKLRSMDSVQLKNNMIFIRGRKDMNIKEATSSKIKLNSKEEAFKYFKEAYTLLSTFGNMDLETTQHPQAITLSQT